jgi:broad specificity phosphatase PhoE
MGKLILIKHAAPEVIPEVSSEQWHLSARGRESCTALAERLGVHAPSVIVSSDELKARQTAERLAKQLGLRYETAAGLHEHDRRGVPHLRSGEFISYIELMLRKQNECVLGNESADEALRRFGEAVEQVLVKYPDDTVAVVSHGTVIALFVAEHDPGHTAFGLWRKLGLPSFVVMSTPGMRVEQIVERI